MPATAKKPMAYREGRADKSKKPSIEIEISPEGEEEENETEGTEKEMDAAPSRSRKRSAKGAKNTKAPMDGEACCAACAKGKPCSGKAKKDGDCPMGKADCEGCPMKKSASDCATCSKRGDSLTPQEYLAACELGIQNRSRFYIRGRLDAMAAPKGKSVKCGASHIPAGKKCRKGGAGAAAPAAGGGGNASAKGRQMKGGGKARLKTGAAILGGMAALGAAAYMQQTARQAGRRRQATNRMNPNKPSASLLVSAMANNRLKGRRDSVWADGFTPESTDLAI